MGGRFPSGFLPLVLALAIVAALGPGRLSMLALVLVWWAQHG